MRYLISRKLCSTIVAALAVVLAPAAADGFAAKKPAEQQWEWQVQIACEGNFCHDGVGVYENGDNLKVAVDRVSRGRNILHVFRLQVWKESGRHVQFQNIADLSDVGVNLDKGPGYFPISTDNCSPAGSCSDESTCASQLLSFLNGFHPACGYALVVFRIDVSLDIESMEVGDSIFLGNEDLIRFTIFNTNPYDGYTLYDQPHNLDAQNIPRYSPLNIKRTAENTWEISVDQAGDYMNYAEYYYTNIGAGRKSKGSRLVPEIPMAADGPFNFRMIWTRSPIMK